MKLFRVLQDKARTADLSGTGAFRWGGRWNSKDTYMLYTSENSSLAMLEYIIPFEKAEMPPQLYTRELEVTDDLPIYTLPDGEYNSNWRTLGLLGNQEQGDHWMQERQYLGIRVRSAINPSEYNCLLNPLYPGYPDLLRLISATEIPLDDRLLKMINLRDKRR